MALLRRRRDARRGGDLVRVVQHAVVHPIDEINHQADDHPDDQPDPGLGGQGASGRPTRVEPKDVTGR